MNPNRRAFGMGTLAALAAASALPAAAKIGGAQTGGIRMSSIPGDPGYTPWARSGYRAVVYLDGVEQKYAETADERLGLVTRLKQDEHGKLMVAGHRPERETVYGRVRIVVPA